MGRWSAAHWKTATFGWLALAVVAFWLGGMVGQKQIDPNTAGPGQSGRMDRILDAGFKLLASESVLIQSRSARAGSPAFKAAIADVVARVSREPVVQNVRSPLAPGNAGQIAKNGRAAVVEFDVRGDKDKAGDRIGPVVDAVAAAQDAHPGFFIGEFGDASAKKAVDGQFGKDLGRAGTFSIPLTLIILVIAFGALVAAGIPLLLGLTAVFGTFGLVALLSHLLPVDQSAAAVVLLIGLAVGVDYSMFYLKRYRQERAAGRGERAALEAAAATSGRSVLVSGLTVMVAMAGMFLTGDETFISFGYATMVVVAMAMLGSLTVLPALLSRLGDNVNRARVPLISRFGRGDGESRIWGPIVDAVLRRPLLSVVIAGGLLLALALPALQLKMANPSPDTYPSSLAIVKTYKHMQQAFPGTALPAHVVVKTSNVNAPAMRAAIGRLERRALASGRMHEPITIDVNRAATVANITVPIDGNGTDAVSRASLHDLRNVIVSQTVGAVAQTEAGVTGLTAEWKDSEDQLNSTLPLVVAFVLVFAFVLMLASFRSIVVAAKAIALNMLSVAAAYGVLVLVFQDGVGKGLLGFTSTAGVSPVVPLLLFVILFGLSMDYHVFIVSRIRESFQRGASMDEAIAGGIRSTAGVVTSAAIVMVAVFSIFMTLSILMFKQFGVGLAAAILIDATIVRGVLLPATMKLLGEWNWYLPRWLEWLPRFDQQEYEPEPEPVTEPAPRRKGKRAFTPARITGLFVIGIVLLGLAYLAAKPAEGSVSVPKGAHPGQLTLHACSYDTEKGSYAADCGTLVVPENRHDSHSRLIALPVTRIKARSARPGAPIFRLEGGPGLSNMHFSDTSRLADRHDVVLVGYRGADGSVRLQCPEVSSALKRSGDFLGTKSFAAYADAFRACADRLRGNGVDLAGYSVPEQVDDLEAARRALGYGKVDLLSESAGTRVAMIYAWRYPASIHRSVMIGANPPGDFLWYPRTIDEQLRRYSAACAADTGCSKRTDDLIASLRATAASMPGSWLFLPVSKGNARVASFFGLMEATSSAAPLSAPMTIDTWLSRGAAGFWFQSTMARLAFPDSFVWGEMAAVARADANFASSYYAGVRDKGSIIGNPGTDFIWAGGRLADAWPAAPDENEYDRVRTSPVPTLVIDGTFDLATPPQNATRELMPFLPNGRQVLLQGLGHTVDFWHQEPAASTRLLTAYFDRGRVDTSLYKPGRRIDFRPGTTDSTIGTIVLAVMLGFAGLAALSLLWLPWRSRRRGGFGHKSSVTLRSLLPVVLGLGGWFAGVLVVLAAFPTVPLDDPLLAVASIGIPIGLGVYWAWTRSDRAARARTAGLAGAVGGALAGAWLGLQVTTGLFGLVTAILGAIAAANLVLLALDIRRDRAAVEELATEPVPDASARIQAYPA
jgi:RND superfamily putative drug exporter